jgi:hypothetical protein
VGFIKFLDQQYLKVGISIKDILAIKEIVEKLRYTPLKPSIGKPNGKQSSGKISITRKRRHGISTS